MDSEKLHALNRNEEIDWEIEDKEHVIEQLMTLYTEKVYLLAFSFVKDQGLAEDISQEVFLKAYKYLDRFRGEASIKSWIYRITVNTAKDFLTKKGFKQLLLHNSFLENFKKDKSSEAIYLEADRNEKLILSILALPAKYREVIVLHYFHDLKVNEVAAALEIKQNTVKTRLARGRKLLKQKWMAKEGEDFYGQEAQASK